MEEKESFDNTGYYTILNVAQDASDAEIKSSYRKLAQVFHPDKTQDGADGADESSVNFMRIQEAYEVLGNPERRQIYDVHGKKGLLSGLEVGDYLRKPEDMHREFQRRQRQEKSERREASVAHRGKYVFKVDACDCVPPFEDGIEVMPELSSMATTNSVQMPLSENTAATIGCQVAVKKRAGGGSFLCGIRRNVTAHDTVEFQATVGLRQLAQLEVSRQLGAYTRASVVTTYQPQAGLGLILSTSRQLSDHYEADLTCHVGPESLMSFGLTRRGLKTFLSGRIEVGASTGIIWRAVWEVTASVSLQMSAKFGTMGIELELGGTQRLTEFSSAGCAVVAGLQGVFVRPKFSRGGHVFEVPIMVSQTLVDYKVLAAAYILPPSISLVVKYCIVRPLKRRAKIQKILSERAERSKDILAAIRTAQKASRTLQAIAARKLKEEAQKGGLVILNAKYGKPSAIKKVQTQEIEEMKAEAEGRQQPNGNHVESHSLDEDSLPSSTANSPNRYDDSASDEDIEVRQAATASSPMPEQWLDVTNAVRYMTNKGELVFHKGYSKAGLMGFADVAIDEEKVLSIVFMHKQKPYIITISNQAGATIPGNLEQPLNANGIWLARKYIQDQDLGKILFPDGQAPSELEDLV